jgi:hypothetical protein
MGRIRCFGIVALGFVSCTGPSPDPADPTNPVPEPEPVPEVPSEQALTAVTGAVHPQVGTIVVVAWEQALDSPVFVEYSFDEGVWLSSPVRELAAGPHEELLLGIPFGTATTWRVVAEGDQRTVSPDQETTTAPAPSEVPIAALLAADPAAWDADHPYVLVSTMGIDYDAFWTLILDRQARVVWARETPDDAGTLYPRITLAGDALLIDETTVYRGFDGGEGSRVIEHRIDGTLGRSWQTPGLHHAFAELPDGGLAYPRASGNFPRQEDITVVAADGTVRQVFDCDAWIDELDLDYAWCASNTLNVDPITGHFLYSLYSLETIIEVDPTTGTAVRWFGHLPGSWAFDPPDQAFLYQHGGYFTDSGTLIVSGFAEPLVIGAVEMVIREYAVDPVTETLTQIWTFGFGERVLGRGFGDVYRFPGGNTLQNCGVARLREATPDAEVAWDVGWDAIDYIGRSTPIADLYRLAPERR